MNISKSSNSLPEYSPHESRINFSQPKESIIFNIKEVTLVKGGGTINCKGGTMVVDPETKKQDVNVMSQTYIS